jgi:phospholipid transport system substrate-binding protein
MMTTIPRRALLAIAAATTLSGTALADDKAETYVAGVLEKANAAFKIEEGPARDAQIDALVDQHVDMRKVARFALGQYARQATPAQMAEYEPLFARYLKSVYRNLLGDYASLSLSVTGSVDRSARDFIVTSKAVGLRPGDQRADIEVLWRIYRDAAGEQKVVDAGAQEIWLAVEQQSQFKSVIANNGGGAAGIDALIRDLKAKLGS